MFGILFAFAMIFLVAVSYLAFKFYRASVSLDADNKLKDGVISALSEDYENVIAQRDNERRRAEIVEKKNSDMETALNIALEDSMPEQVKIVPVMEYNRIHRKPSVIQTPSKIPGIAPNPEKLSVATGKLFIEDTATGELFDISTLMGTTILEDRPTMKAEQILDFKTGETFETKLPPFEMDQELFETLFGPPTTLPPTSTERDNQ